MSAHRTRTPALGLPLTRLGTLLATLLAALLGACSDPPAPARAPAEGARVGVPPAVLARLREEAAAKRDDEVESGSVLLAALDLVERGGGEAGSEERWLVLSGWLRLAAADGRVEEALEARQALVDEHGGGALFPTGQRLARRDVAAGLMEAAVEEARRRIEGPSGDWGRATAALEVAAAVELEADDPDTTAALRRARTWVDLEQAGGLAAGWAPHEGPRVVAYAEDFDVGEPVLLSVLRRWREQGEGRPTPLRVGVVPLLRGHVREGIRRIDEPDRERERAHLARRLEGTGIALEPSAPTDAELGSALGLSPGTAAVLVVDPRGRILGRLSGRGLDPRPLDPVVERLVSR